MKQSLPIENCQLKNGSDKGFSLVEVLMVVVLLSLIVLALMTVFNSTESAFRSGITQTGLLEDSRAAMVLMGADLKTMTQCGSYNNATFQQPGFNNTVFANYQGAPNFFVISNLYYLQPLVQSLPGSVSGQMRTNVLQDFFVLSRVSLRGHYNWVGVGYAVSPTNNAQPYQPLYPLYRFITNCPVETDPQVLFNQYMGAVVFNSFTNTGWSHVVDGVVDLRVRAYDVNGVWLTNGYAFNQPITVQNVTFYPTVLGETGYYFASNTLPASVEVQLGVLEDHTLAHAEAFPPQSLAQSNYLAQQAGHVHIFRERVSIPNLDPTAYQ